MISKVLNTLFRSVYLCVICLSLFVVNGCKPGIPGEVLSESLMEDILYDYHLAQGMADLGDSVQEKRYIYVQSVFRKYDITEEEFDSSMVWYSGHASYLKEIYARINERFDAEAKALGVGTKATNIYAKLTNKGDTANIWMEKDFFLLKPATIDNRMNFLMEADSSFYPGDVFLWRFKPRFVYKDGTREAYAGLTVRFENDSVLSTTQRLGGDYQIEMYVRPKDDLKVKEIYGFIYVPNPKDQTSFKMVIINEPALIRFHKQQPKKRVEKKNDNDSSVQRTNVSQNKNGGELKNIQERRLSPHELREESKGTSR